MEVRIELAVACALVDRDGRVLVGKRPQDKFMGGFWEFPGGKIEAGETPESALIRELKEELAIDMPRACLAPFGFASHAYEAFHLLMPLYVARKWDEKIGTRIIAHAHDELAWVRPRDLFDRPMLEANTQLIAMLRDFL